MSRRKHVSIRESLKEFENPASNLTFKDIDDDEITGARLNYDGENGEFAEKIDEEDQSQLKNYGNLRKKNFLNQEELDSKYFGSTISRKSLVEEGWGQEESQHEGKDSEVSIDDSMSDNEQSSMMGDDHDIDNDTESDYDSDRNQDGVEATDEDDSEDDGGNLADGSINIDFSKLPADLKPSMKPSNNSDMNSSDDEDSDDVSHFNKSKLNKDIEKGKATKSQLELLDALLEMRIRMQKLLQITNRYPQENSMNVFLGNANQETVGNSKSGKKMLKDILIKLLHIQAALLSQNEETKKLLTGTQKFDSKKHADSDEEIPSDTDNEEENESESESEQTNLNKLDLPSKRKNTFSTVDFEEEISKRHKAYQSYQEQEINKWYDKTSLVSAKLNNKGFGAFERSTNQQIKQVLSDKPRLIKRTQLRRTPYEILGKSKDINNDVRENNCTELVDSHLQDYDENIFDDSDFYHELLKELIERKSNINKDDPIAAGRQWLEIQKLRTKVKKKVDTRASKGRKVRYNVHQKLVSFMAPENIGSFSDQAKNDLFASLFSNVGNHPIT